MDLDSRKSIATVIGTFLHRPTFLRDSTRGSVAEELVMNDDRCFRRRAEGPVALRAAGLALHGRHGAHRRGRRAGVLHASPVLPCLPPKSSRTRAGPVMQ